MFFKWILFGAEPLGALYTIRNLNTGGGEEHCRRNLNIG